MSRYLRLRQVLTGYNEAFILSEEKRKELIKKDSKTIEIIKPILRGRDINRYSHEFANLFIITTFPSLHIDIESYPSIKQHLLSYGFNRLKQTGDLGSRKKTNHEWFETQDPISYWEDLKKPKIIWKRIGSMLRFSYDETGAMALDSTCFATGKHIKYLVGFLNSKLGNYMLQDAPKTGTGDLLISVQAIHPLFVVIPTADVEEKIDNLVDNILKNSNLSQKYEKDIDQIIYEIYNFSKEEINFIESSI